MNKVIYITVSYLICWLISYVIINGTENYESIVSYFIQGWTFSGFVKPTYTWVLSLAIFLVYIIVLFVLKKVRDKQGA